MKVTSSLEGAAYRVHVPRWAYAPTSGAGAAEHGGRLNRVGLPALYLALDATTALEEHRQLSVLMPPGLLVSYELCLGKVVDFSEGYTPAWDPLWLELTCDWRWLWFNKHIEPPSWLLADIALEAGAAGILFPSMANPGGTNLVLYTEALQEEDRLVAYDPADDLPKDQRSWE
ncbi:RES family NAD+ phosphorylase [Halomonas cerina]|uniref:RES domain-containing protein n=1 Tax=Halomonas cerina TaxID=447424 RepID=A0A839VAQ8_9GAMM|nr:RES family NAD+ phosphorylase [Halomonas cerina]MBB3192572.1 RES domain-containing protein [Halomonas cerina]